MFKKTKLAAASAVVLGLSSMTAQAVSVNHSGSDGQVLIFPYYNVNNSFTSHFNIVNTTDAYKAVKVRFRESKTSNDLLDFNLYMSPHDVFTMDLTLGEDSEGEASVILKTTDKSCTHPAIKADGEPLRDVYEGAQLDVTTEGYLEVIEMGEIYEGATVLKGQTRMLIASEGLLHDSAGVPADCSVIDLAWKQGVFMQGGARSNNRFIDIVHPDAPSTYQIQNIDSATDYYGQPNAKNILPPKGGLIGTSIFLDVPNVAAFVADPISVVNYSTRAQHYLSSDAKFYLLPSLASGNIQTTEHISYGAGIVNGVNVDGVYKGYQNEYSLVERDYGLDDVDMKLKGAQRRLRVPSGINPLPISDAMLVDTLSNQYFLGDQTATDWVISAPMKKHGIYNDYMYIPNGDGYDWQKDSKVEFYDQSTATTVANNGYWKYLGKSDVRSVFEYYDREEQHPKEDPSPDDFSPPLPQNSPDTIIIPADKEVNIISFNSGDHEVSVLGSKNAQHFSLEYSNGWARLDFDKPQYDLDEDRAESRYRYWYDSALNGPVTGVPLYGFMASIGTIGENKHVGETIPHALGKKR